LDDTLNPKKWIFFIQRFFSSFKDPKASSLKASKKDLRRLTFNGSSISKKIHSKMYMVDYDVKKMQKIMNT
jgi:hypothetical protein